MVEQAGVEMEENSQDVDDEEESTFTDFFRLAPELQIKVWKHALPEPRIVQLRMIANPKQRSTKSKDGKTIAGTSHSTPPKQRFYITTDIPCSALLQTCKVSRQIMLETYSVCIDSKHGWKFYLDGEGDWVVMSDPFLGGGLLGALWEANKTLMYEKALRGLKRLVFPGGEIVF